MFSSLALALGLRVSLSFHWTLTLDIWNDFRYGYNEKCLHRVVCTSYELNQLQHTQSLDTRPSKCVTRRCMCSTVIEHSRPSPTRPLMQLQELNSSVLREIHIADHPSLQTNVDRIVEPQINHDPANIYG